MYNQWVAEFCAESGGRLHGVAVVPIEHGELAITVMDEAKALGLVRHHRPARRSRSEPGSSRPGPLLRGGGRPRHALGRPRGAGHPPAQDRRGPLRQLHPGPLRELSLRPDVRHDRSGQRRRVRSAPRPAGRLLGGGGRDGCRGSSSASTSTTRRVATGSPTAGAVHPPNTSRPATSWSPASPTRMRCRAWWTCSVTVRHVRQRLSPLGRGLAPGHHRAERARRGPMSDASLARVAGANARAFYGLEARVGGVAEQFRVR